MVERVSQARGLRRADGADCTTWTCELAGGDSTGGLGITKLGVTAETMVWVDAQGQVQVMAMNAMSNLDPDNVDIWSDNGWTNFLITIIEPFIMEGVVTDINMALTDTINTQLGPALASALNTLEVDALFDLPNLGGGDSIPVNLVTAMAETVFHDGVAPPDPSPPASGEIHQSAGQGVTSLGRGSHQLSQRPRRHRISA